MQAQVTTSRFEAPHLPGTWKLPAGRAITLPLYPTMNPDRINDVVEVLRGV